MSRHRILSDLVPLSTVIQGGAVGGWGPAAEANTAESFGTTFNLDLRFLQVFWFRVTGATGPTATSTPSTRWRSISRGPEAITSQLLEEHQRALLVAQLQNVRSLALGVSCFF